MIPKHIKDKYKQLKYSHLKKLYDKNLSKYPENCRYNKVIVLPNKYKINICTYDLSENAEVEMCYKKAHSKNCNAFCFRSSKEELKEIFLKELKDDPIRATKFKDINILYWLYPNLMLEDFPKESLLSKLINYFF